MSKKTFRVGDLVTFKYAGTRSFQGVVKEDRGPIGMKGRVLYLIEFRRDPQSPDVSRIELPADDLTIAGDTVSLE